jgi:putative NIF3 family GTP cyclohydrolase 1 type 2
MMRLLFIILVCVATTANAQSISAGEAIAKIRARYPATPNPNTVDTIKAGDPSTQVTGIAVTFMDTMEMLREAARRGDNLVITHEPTFYNHPDDVSQFVNDPVYKEKLAFIKQHHMVIFRLHDAIHQQKPDPFPIALAGVLGWEKYVNPATPHVLDIPAISLRDLVRQVQAKLQSHTLRVIGDPSMIVTHVSLYPGASGLAKHVFALNANEHEVLLAGDAQEWETVVYAQDAAIEGRPKALLLLGHKISEEPGMEVCAKELREVFPNTRIDHIPTPQPFWDNKE